MKGYATTCGLARAIRCEPDETLGPAVNRQEVQKTEEYVNYARSVHWKIQTPGNFRSHGPGPSTMRGKGSTYGLKDVKEIARKSVRSAIAGSFSSKLFSHKERKFEPPEFRVEVHHSRNIF